MGKLTSICVLSLIVSGVLVFGGTALAQYAPPVGSVTLVTSDGSPPAGSQVTVTGQVVDESGNPIAGVDCSLAIASEPGADASLPSDVVQAKTDANGNVSTSLNVGTTPGLVVVKVQCGSHEGRVLVQVAGARVTPPQAPVELQAPRTGDGGLL